jgi:hypothetical protein
LWSGKCGLTWVFFCDTHSFVKTFGREHPEEILAGEFLLCQGIRFAFDVKHPFRALRGAIMELKRLGIEVRWELLNHCLFDIR